MDIEELNLSSDEALLVNLKKILNYQISIWLLFVVSFFFISSILIILLAVIAVSFFLYIIFILYRNRKYGWIATLFLTILIPTIVLAFIVEHTYTVAILLMIEVAIFFIYCAALRLTVDGWVRDIQTARLIDYQTKKVKEQKGYNKSL